MSEAYRRFGHHEKHTHIWEDGLHVGMHGEVVRKVGSGQNVVAAARHREYEWKYPHPFDPQ